jgi:hypothetical protein
LAYLPPLSSDPAFSPVQFASLNGQLPFYIPMSGSASLSQLTQFPSSSSLPFSSSAYLPPPSFLQQPNFMPSQLQLQAISAMTPEQQLQLLQQFPPPVNNNGQPMFFQ